MTSPTTTGWTSRRPRCCPATWPLCRYDPALAGEGRNPLQLDSTAPSLLLEKYVCNETRYTTLAHNDSVAAK